MNNKLFKRIVAAAASAVMLGSCAFATTLSNVSYDGSADNGVLSFTYNNGKADKVTYVAYAATRATDTDTNAVTVNGTKYVLGEMVAINQFDNLAAAAADAAGTPETVPVDKTKLANADAIVLKSGDSLGSPVAVEAVALQTAPATEHTITFANVQEGYATPTLKVADGSLVTDMLAKIADPTKTKTGGKGDKLDWVFVGWYTDETLTTKLDKSAEAKITADMTLYAKYVQQNVFGDVNGDGKTDGNDALAINVYVRRGNVHPGYPDIGAGVSNTNVEGKKYTGVYKLGDVNGDGTVDGNDALAINVYVRRGNVHPGYPNIGTNVPVVKD